MSEKYDPGGIRTRDSRAYGSHSITSRAVLTTTLQDRWVLLAVGSILSAQVKSRQPVKLLFLETTSRLVSSVDVHFTVSRTRTLSEETLPGITAVADMHTYIYKLTRTIY